jgi:hypothetical protein
LHTYYAHVSKELVCYDNTFYAIVPRNLVCADLVCPVTQTVFLDPVLTAAGHVYERAAIEKFMSRSGPNLIDPLTRESLTNTNLTPVFVLRSRALEYRESTARLCVEMACVPMRGRAPKPIDYLRRAVELCADAGFLPQGLTQELVGYVQSHASNAYDNLAMEEFARGLRSNGYADRAAGVYFGLMCEEHDRQKQAELLKRCLECWQGQHAILRSGGSSEDPPVSIAETGALVPLSGCAPDGLAIKRLVGLLDRKAPLAWIIDVAGEAGLGFEFTSRLCEHLLFPPPSLPVNTAGTDASNAAETPLPWATEKEVLIKYTRVLTSGIQVAQYHMQDRIGRLERSVGGDVGRRTRFNVRRIDESVGSPDVEMFGMLDILAAFLRHPIVVFPCTVLAALGSPSNPVTRAAHLLPFAAFLPPVRGQSIRRSRDYGAPKVPHNGTSVTFE